MSLKERFNPRSVFVYVFGLFLVSLGSASSVRSNLGSGPAVSLCYTATLITGINFGVATFLWMSSLILAQILILRKDFEISMLFQIIAGFLIGYFNNIGLMIVDLFPPAVSLLHRLLYVCISSAVGGLGVWLYASAGLINLPTEGIVKAISLKSKKDFPIIKVLFDVVCVVTSGVICLIKLHTIGSVGIGTVIIALTLGFMVGIYKKNFRAALEKFLGHKAAI